MLIFDILKIDHDKLNNALFLHGCKKQKNPKIIMSEETWNCIKKLHHDFMICMQPYVTNEGIISNYDGYDIVADNSVPFGKVEIK